MANQVWKQLYTELPREPKEAAEEVMAKDCFTLYCNKLQRLM